MAKKNDSSAARRKYELNKSKQGEHSVRMMCRLLDVAPSGHYAWLKNPVSDRAKEDARLLGLIKASFTACQGVYGAPRVFLDLREAGGVTPNSRTLSDRQQMQGCQKCIGYPGVTAIDPL